ncbi:MAG: alpha/beta hydrolase-fold protein [Woeseia sp.]
MIELSLMAHARSATRRRINTALLLLLALLLTTSSLAAETASHGRLLELQIHGKSLDNNLLGFSTERDVLVYLPPSYDRGTRHYPVVYVLHGITDPLSTWTVPWSDEEIDYGTIQNLMDRGINSGLLQEMILVLFDARTPYFGCHYVNSPVKGNWQDFLAHDLVSYIDSHYRTIARRESRGVMGHSMGGYGALRAGLDRPDIFSAVYGLSPSVLGWSGDLSAQNPAFGVLATEDEPSDHINSDFYVGAFIGISQAFSPNPNRPPYFADFPFKMSGKQLIPNQPAHELWETNFLANRIDHYLEQPFRLNGIRFDAGFADQYTHIPPTSRKFSEALTDKNIEHTFEMYNGDHRNRLWGESGRLYADVLPYLSTTLMSE